MMLNSVPESIFTAEANIGLLKLGLVIIRRMVNMSRKEVNSESAHCQLSDLHVFCSE